jgi:peptidoglycan/xylan/chitin deacetylase (PgdA/CDA1 family)
VALAGAPAGCGGSAAAHARLHLRPRAAAPGKRSRPKAAAPSPQARLAAAIAAGNAEIHRLVRYGLPLYCGGARGREVAFTFDDGPGVYTHYALKKLRQWHERATFFVVGKSIAAWPGWLAREIRVAAIGDHTTTHPWMTSLSPSQVYWQLEHTKRVIEQATGEHVDLWRPPYGAVDSTVIDIARRLGLLTVMWSTDSRDSLGAESYQIIRNVEAGLHPGAIILFHENRGQTIRALTTLLPLLHRRHLRSVSIPELLAADPPSLAQLRRGWEGCTGAGKPAGTGA